MVTLESHDLVSFGKISETDTKFSFLSNVFNMPCTMHNETKQVSNVLVKRGSEWHAPNLFVLLDNGEAGTGKPCFYLRPKGPQ